MDKAVNISAAYLGVFTKWILVDKMKDGKSRPPVSGEDRQSKPSSYLPVRYGVA